MRAPPASASSTARFECCGFAREGPANGAAAAPRSGSCRRDWRCRGRRCPAPSRGSARRCRACPSPSEAEGSSPREPASIEASSVRMSPNMFSVTSTSKSRGRRIRCIAAESTSMCSSVTSGNSLRHQPRCAPRATAARSPARSTCRSRSDARAPRARQLRGHAHDALDLRRGVAAHVAPRSCASRRFSPK